MLLMTTILHTTATGKKLKDIVSIKPSMMNATATVVVIFDAGEKKQRDYTWLEKDIASAKKSKKTYKSADELFTWILWKNVFNKNIK